MNSYNIQIVIYFLKWIFLSAIIGLFAGSASAIFLTYLDHITTWREVNTWIIVFLPVGGLLIGLIYYYLGNGVEAGNNLLIDEINKPTKTLSFKMAPLVLLGTFLTHLFGGSAGREGTAVQMGGSIADQLNHVFKFSIEDRKAILLCGVSAGFASVFGTPLAAIIFALEVFYIGRLRYHALLPCAISAILADLVCDAWGVHHTHYTIGLIPKLTVIYVAYCIISGIAFGIVAKYYVILTHFISDFLKRTVLYPPFRPALGGVIVAIAVFSISSTKYIGLGIPTILSAFETKLPPYDFLVKILFTAVTLGAGFKGGEVTPLFFIGATLGNALSLFIPLPMALLVGVGFVAVFSGAANTPLASSIMAIELFGIEIGIYATIGCITAYIFSGHTGIYSSQIIGNAKHESLAGEEGKRLSDFLDIKKGKQ